MEQNSNHVKAVLKGCLRGGIGKDTALTQIKAYLPENGKGKDDTIKSAIKKACGGGPKAGDLGHFLDGLVTGISEAKSKGSGDAESKYTKKDK